MTIEENKTADSILDEENREEELYQNRNNRIFKIAVRVILIMAAINIVFQIFRIAEMKLSTLSKSKFSYDDTKVFENETGIIIPANGKIIKAELRYDDYSQFLKFWIDGIESCNDFISECTAFDTDNYESLNRNEYGMSRYYSIVPDGEEDPLECYIYKNQDDSGWTACIIDNDITIEQIRDIF